jgi:hypothetical protein
LYEIERLGEWVDSITEMPLGFDGNEAVDVLKRKTIDTRISILTPTVKDIVIDAGERVYKE